MNTVEDFANILAGQYDSDHDVMEVDSVEVRALQVSSHSGQSLSIEEETISELKIWNRDNGIPDLYRSTVGKNKLF
jgi:hypothetical protein